MIKAQFEKHGKRCSLNTSGGIASIDIRDVSPSEKRGALYHGGTFCLSPGQALELATALTEWAERQKEKRRVAKAGPDRSVAASSVDQFAPEAIIFGCADLTKR